MINNKNNFPLDFAQCCFLFLKELPTGTLLPCLVLILSMARNQSDVENLVKNCLNTDFVEILIVSLDVSITCFAHFSGC